MRGWLDGQREGASVAAALPTAGAPEPAASDRIALARAHLRSVLTALPGLPAEIDEAISMLLGEMTERGLLQFLLLLAGYVALGYGLEWLFWTATTGLRRWIGDLRCARWPSACGSPACASRTGCPS